MTWIRCFGGQVLDMIELYVVQDTARTLIQFKGEKCRIGVKPLLSFSGTPFESPVPNQYTLAKSIFVDFFRGGETHKIDVEGLQLIITFFAGEDGPEGQTAQIHMRCWKIITKRSGQKMPRVEIEEIGPRIDFTVGRIKEADETLRKEAMKKVKGTEVSLLLYCAVARLLLILPYPDVGKTKKEHRDGYSGRQDWEDTSRQARPRQSTDAEDERFKGIEEKQRHGYGRRRRRQQFGISQRGRGGKKGGCTNQETKADLRWHLILLSLR